MRAAPETAQPQKKAEEKLAWANDRLGAARRMRLENNPSQAIHIATRAIEAASEALVYARFARWRRGRGQAEGIRTSGRQIIRMALQQLRGERGTVKRRGSRQSKREGEHQRHAHSVLQGALRRDV